MKSAVLTLVAVWSFTILNAQVSGDSLATQDSLNPSSDSSDVEVVITPKKGQDSTIVRVAGMKIIVLSDEESKKSNEIIVDGIVITDSTENKKKSKEYDNVSHWAGVRIGVNGYLNNNGLPLAVGDQHLELDYGRSVSWDLNLLEKDFNIYKQHVELVTGLGLHFANYTFKSQYATLQNTDPFTYAIDSANLLTKNKLKATYITAPLMLGFSTHKDENKAFRIAAGAQVSWRIGSRLKQEFVANGETYKPKVRSDFDLNPFLFHAIAAVGYGPVNVFASYGLNPLFQAGKTTTELTPFDVGLQLMF